MKSVHASIHFSIYDINSVKCFHSAFDFISIFVEFLFPVSLLYHFFREFIRLDIFYDFSCFFHFSHFRIPFVAVNIISARCENRWNAWIGARFLIQYFRISSIKVRTVNVYELLALAHFECNFLINDNGNLPTRHYL